MPIKKRTFLMNKSIRAGRGHPGDDLFNIIRAQRDTVRYNPVTTRIMFATTGMGIQKTTAEIGKGDLAVVSGVKFQQATTTAPVTQGFPLMAVEIRKGKSFPESRADRARIGARPCPLPPADIRQSAPSISPVGQESSVPCCSPLSFVEQAMSGFRIPFRPAGRPPKRRKSLHHRYHCQNQRDTPQD